MITISGLTKQYKNETVISYRDLTFEDGKSYVLLGASGCGKSTYLNMIAGILTPTSGSIAIDGVEMNKVSQKEKDRFRIQKIGYVFQDFKLIDEMTVEDNISVLALEHVDLSSLKDTLSALGILPLRKRKVKNLSGGEKQRVAIARAFVKRPDIILADEPTGNLNYEIGERVVKQMLDVAKGKTLVAVTHDDRLAQYFDFVIDMNEITSTADAGKEGAR